MRNQEGIKIKLLKKVHRRICVRGITFLTAHFPFYAVFCCFLHLLPFLNDVNCSMVPIKIHNIAMDGNLCDVKNMKISWYLI